MKCKYWEKVLTGGISREYLGEGLQRMLEFLKMLKCSRKI